ncbi:DUF4291 domain-containing protein [Aquimarina aquimarini]|uniref:DUF4291 domain-containing protein n=1 Tax=Aquimarina aquimarini TaxID=1191734 RepID=UPI000D55AF8A|nr:DUF4291 domain-containing protein [Aquimarina aquimarini]
MKLELEKYTEQQKKWPQQGYHIMGQYNDDKIVVYQSYRPEIGNFAVKNQYFGGAFSLERMTWIKPNFLWMMYRNGWGTKEGQEVVLAIHLKKKVFEKYLKNAVYSSFKPELYTSYESWQEDIQQSNIRLQWDPDHDPYGAKLERRAIQIGLRKEFIKSFAQEDIIEIEDISAFVNEQYQLVKSQNIDKLMIPKEKPLVFEDEKLNTYLMLK